MIAIALGLAIFGALAWLLLGAPEREPSEPIGLTTSTEPTTEISRPQNNGSLGAGHSGAPEPSPLPTPQAITSPASLRVLLLDESGAPLPRSSLSLFAVIEGKKRFAHHSAGAQVQNVRTDEQGQALFDDVETGVALEVWSNQPRQRLIPADLASGEDEVLSPSEGKAPAPQTHVLQHGDALTLTLIAVEELETGFMGRLVDRHGAPIAGMAIELLKLSPDPRDDPRSIAWLTTDADGAFEKELLREGDLQLKSCTILQGNEVVTLLHDLHFEAGSLHDLGTLVLGAGDLQIVRVQARLDGEAVPFSTLYDAPVRVSLALSPPDRYQEYREALCKTLTEVPVETDLHLRGFPAGRYPIDGSVVVEQEVRAGVRARGIGGGAELVLGGGAPVIAWIDYYTPARLLVTLSGADAPSASGQLKLMLNGPSHELESATLVELPVSPDKQIEFTGQRADYTLIVDHLAPTERDATGFLLWQPPQHPLAAAQRVVLDADEVSVRVDLQPACVLSGRVNPPPLASHGFPVVQFELLDATTSQATARSLVTHVGLDGGFRLSGLPAHTRLRLVRHPEIIVETGRPGSVIEVGDLGVDHY